MYKVMKKENLPWTIHGNKQLWLMVLFGDTVDG